MKIETYDVAIIGGGPAGLMAAATAAENGASVILIEKTESFGTKLLTTGKGRCNITNTITETKEFIEHFGKKGRFLYPTLNTFGTTETINFFNSKGLDTIIEKDFKIFPASNDANDVLNVFLKQIKRCGGTLANNCNIEKIITKDNHIEKILLEDREIIATSFILATGGCSYPQTGSTGDGYKYAEKLGHTIVEPRAVLTPVLIDEKWVSELQGLTLNNVKFSIYKKKQLIVEERNDAIFTSNGLSGPAIYNLSRKLTKPVDKMRLKIDLFPDIQQNDLDLEFQGQISANNRKRIKNIASDFIQPTLLPVIFTLANVDPEVQAANLAKDERKRIIKLLKALPLDIHKFYGFEKAVITAGGINLKEIDGKTMQSKIIDNLYFAGELIDLDGPTGGFNLQICWTTGYAAGISAYF